MLLALRAVALTLKEEFWGLRTSITKKLAKCEVSEPFERMGTPKEHINTKRSASCLFIESCCRPYHFPTTRFTIEPIPKAPMQDLFVYALFWYLNPLWHAASDAPLVPSRADCLLTDTMMGTKNPQK